METRKLTIRLPKEDIEYAKAYAKAHGLTVTEVVERYLRRMRDLDAHSPSSEVEAISGVVPLEADPEDEYHQHIWEKHAR